MIATNGERARRGPPDRPCSCPCACSARAVARTRARRDARAARRLGVDARRRRQRPCAGVDRRAAGHPVRGHEPDRGLRPRPRRGLPRARPEEDRRGRPRLPRRQRRRERRDLGGRAAPHRLAAAPARVRARARDRRERRPARPGPASHARQHPGDPGRDAAARAGVRAGARRDGGAAELRRAPTGGTSGRSTPSSRKRNGARSSPSCSPAWLATLGSIRPTASTRTPRARSSSPTTSGRSCGRCSSLS